jgi:hypothetical protein
MSRLHVTPAIPTVRHATAPASASHGSSTARVASVGGSAPFGPVDDALRAASAAAAAGSKSGSGLFFLLFALLLVAACRETRVVRLPVARRLRPAPSLLLEHPG